MGGNFAWLITSIDFFKIPPVDVFLGVWKWLKNVTTEVFLGAANYR